MSSFALELLDGSHDRKSFESGLPSVDADQSMHGVGIGTRLLALARRIAVDSLGAAGGVGMVVDAASEDLISFYEKFGFRRISRDSRRLFLPTRSLVMEKGQ